MMRFIGILQYTCSRCRVCLSYSILDTSSLLERGLENLPFMSPCRPPASHPPVLLSVARREECLKEGILQREQESAGGVDIWKPRHGDAGNVVLGAAQRPTLAGRQVDDKFVLLLHHSLANRLLLAPQSPTPCRPASLIFP
ncbi:hypothetical protein O3P69_017203 [Scylla paramamosain]|uniref:Uncharacterized protein n=1 Tax=Scylla paramamosain TaxID=85552 RepID=A0AAW0TUL9_SCYPA